MSALGDYIWMPEGGSLRGIVVFHVCGGDWAVVLDLDEKYHIVADSLTETFPYFTGLSALVIRQIQDLRRSLGFLGILGSIANDFPVNTFVKRKYILEFGLIVLNLHQSDVLIFKIDGTFLIIDEGAFEEKDPKTVYMEDQVNDLRTKLCFPTT